MRIGYIKPSFMGEKRIGLLPKHIPLCSKEDERRFEQGYGESLGICDEAYGTDGGFTREDLFAWADVIYSIKVPQPNDYELFRENQVLVGWVRAIALHQENILISIG